MCLWRTRVYLVINTKLSILVNEMLFSTWENENFRQQKYRKIFSHVYDLRTANRTCCDVTRLSLMVNMECMSWEHESNLPGARAAVQTVNVWQLVINDKMIQCR